MTTIAILILTTIAAISLLVTSIQYNRRRNEVSHFLQQFHRLGVSYNIRFSNEELLNGTNIGLDNIQRKLLVLRKRNGANTIAKMIDLSEVKMCVLEKQYNRVLTAAKKQARPEQRLERLVMRLLLVDGTTEEIDFYNARLNSIMDLTKLANKAEHWEVLIKKLLEPKKQIA